MLHFNSLHTHHTTFFSFSFRSPPTSGEKDPAFSFFLLLIFSFFFLSHMGCGQSKHDDVAAGNTIARKRSSIRNSWRRNKDAALAHDKSQKSVTTVDEGQAPDAKKSKVEEGNVKEIDDDVGSAEKKAEEDAQTEEDVAAGSSENAKVEEEEVIKQDKAVAEVEEAPAAERTKEKEDPVPMVVKVDEKTEEAGGGKGEVEATPVEEEIKEEAKAGGDVTQEEEENVATEIKQSPVAVEYVKLEETTNAAEEEATGAEKKVEVVEEKEPEKDVDEKQNVEVVEEIKAIPVSIPEIKVEEPIQEAESVKSETVEEKQQEKQPEVEKAIKDEGFSTPIGEERLSIEKVDLKSLEERREEEKSVEEVKTA